MSDIIQVNPLVFGGEGESVHANMFVKLWENPAPTSNFAAQSIALSSNDYDFLMWVFTYATNNARTVSVISDDGGTILSIRSALSSTPDHTRIVSTVTPDDKIHFTLTDCYYNSSQTDNSCLIPVFVYGFKKSLDITAIVSNVSTDARQCMLSDGVTSVETELDKKVEGWTLAGNVTSTSLVTVTVPATAKEILAVLVNPSNVILLSQVIPKALMSSGASLKDVANTAKELYYNGSKWKVTDATYTGKIYYR